MKKALLHMGSCSPKKFSNLLKLIELSHLKAVTDQTSALSQTHLAPSTTRYFASLGKRLKHHFCRRKQHSERWQLTTYAWHEEEKDKGEEKEEGQGESGIWILLLLLTSYLTLGRLFSTSESYFSSSVKWDDISSWITHCGKGFEVATVKV